MGVEITKCHNLTNDSTVVLLMNTEAVKLFNNLVTSLNYKTLKKQLKDNYTILNSSYSINNHIIIG